MDSEQLIEVACERTGLGPDVLSGHEFREGLDRLVEGLRGEARLNEVGTAMAPDNLLMYLVNRLQLDDWHRDNPEIAERDVAPIVVMIGMGRTGTTIIHDLLSQDPDNRVPLTWEVDQPFPPPETATYDTDRRIGDVQARIDIGHDARPDIRAMHPTGARLAQECIRMTGCEFASLIFLSQFGLPSYMEWLTNEADMAPAYRLHRRFLQLLQWRHPGDRWIVKSGAHLWALPALLAEYPDAWFVQTHRDPVRVIASLSSLFAAVRSSFSDEVTVPQVAGEWAESILDALDRSVTAREDGSVASNRVVDVQYEAFMASPFAEIRRIYEHLGLELTPPIEARMQAFLADNTREKHGVHRYSFADSGLDEGALRERASRYVEFFDVPVEP